jgi:hypothetical protein
MFMRTDYCQKHVDLATILPLFSMGVTIQAFMLREDNKHTEGENLYPSILLRY